MEAEAVDPLAWGYEYTGGEVEVVADVYQNLKQMREQHEVPTPQPLVGLYLVHAFR